MIEQIPPWGTVSKWEKVNQGLNYLIKKHKKKLSLVFDLAREIEKELELIFPVQDKLCLLTCSNCPDPCCLNATVWFDFKDLLFIHLTGFFVPHHQLIEKRGDQCTYHSPKGCRLHRLARPWTCTLYFCPSQNNNFKLRNNDAIIDYENSIGFLKTARIKLENDFIDVVS